MDAKCRTTATAKMQGRAQSALMLSSAITPCDHLTTIETNLNIIIKRNQRTSKTNENQQSANIYKKKTSILLTAKFNQQPWNLLATFPIAVKSLRRRQ